MSAPEPGKPLLTAIEKERLSDKNLDPNIRKRNDMIVRKKIKSWLSKADDVGFALDHLSTRKFRKELDDEDVYELFWLGLEFLKILDFAPIENLSGVPLVTKPVVTSEKDQNDVCVVRATERDFERNYHLDLIKEEIEKMVSTNDFYKRYRFKMETPETGKGFWDGYDQKKQDLEAKISASDKMIAEDPSNAKAWYEKGVALWCLRKDEEALESLDKAIDLPSTLMTFGNAIHVKGIILEDLGRHVEAEANALLYHLRLTKCDPSNPCNFADMGDYFCSKDRYKEAVECYDEAIRLDPSNSVFWTNKGEALYETGNFKRAIHCFDKAIELKSSYSHPFEGKGKALKALGRDEEADRCFQKAKELTNKILEKMTTKTPTPFDN